MENSKFFQNIFIIFSLIFFSLIISLTYNFEHFAIAPALILNDTVQYLDSSNIFYITNKNAPSLMSYLIKYLYNWGISVSFISKILTFFSIFFNLSGIFLLSKLITSSNILSFLIAFTSIFLKKNFGDIDYPTMIFSPHTNGVIAYSICTLIFGLITLKKQIYSIIFSIVLICLHLTLGLWMLSIILFSNIIFAKKINILENKKDNFTLVFFLFFAILFFLYVYYNSSEIVFEFNQKDYDDYMTYVDAHRTNYGQLSILNFNYLFKTLILLIFIISAITLFKHSQNEKIKFVLRILLLNILISGIIYISYKLLPQIYPDIIVNIIPQRFFVIHSIFGYAIIISLVYKFLKDKLNRFKLNLSFIFIFIVLIFHLVQQNKVFKYRYNEFKKNQIIDSEDNFFWERLKNLKINGYALTSNELCNSTIIKSNHPIFMCFQSLDYIPYMPKLASSTNRNLKNILGINFLDIKIKNFAAIVDEELREYYEKKNEKEWLNIKKQHNIDIIVVPNNWKINLKKILSSNNYAVYKTS